MLAASAAVGGFFPSSVVEAVVAIVVAVDGEAAVGRAGADSAAGAEALVALAAAPAEAAAPPAAGRLSFSPELVFLSEATGSAVAMERENKRGFSL